MKGILPYVIPMGERSKCSSVVTSLHTCTCTYLMCSLLTTFYMWAYVFLIIMGLIVLTVCTIAARTCVVYQLVIVLQGTSLSVPFLRGRECTYTKQTKKTQRMCLMVNTYKVAQSPRGST